MIFKISGVDAKAWFLALYLPAPWQWPLIAAMILVGLAVYGASVLLKPVARP